jgi:hypothetical protein
MRILKVRILVLIVLSLTYCVLLGAGQHPVERPFQISGDITLTIDLRTCSPTTGICSAVREDWGEATHVGRYSSIATNVLVNVVTGYVSGSGVMTAANGDQLFWEKGGDFLTITGGTGRFQNATGEFETSHPPAAIAYPDPATAVVTHTFEGSGTITY